MMNNGTKQGKGSIEKMLWGLHKELCVYFVGLLNDKENPPKSGTLDIVRQFLRDNKISIEHSNRVSGGSAGLSSIVNDLESWASSLDPEEILERREERKKDDDDSIPEIKIFQ